MEATFDQDVAVTRVGEDRYAAEVVPGYGVPGGAPNGGYLTALAANALLDRLDIPDPLTVTTHYLAPPSEAPVEIHTEAMKLGGRHRSGTARVLQGGVEVVRVTGTFTDLSRATGATVVHGTPPDLPPIDECMPVADAPRLPPMFAKTTLHVTPASIAWAQDKPTGRALLEGWTGIAGSSDVSSLGVLFLADAIPPPVFNMGVGFGWVPTLELTVQVRAVPAPGPLAVRFETRFLTDGYLELDGEMWDQSGRLVGLARQIALAPRSL